MKGTFAFTVNAGRDQDIIAWLEEQPNRSAAIREAIRAYISQPDLLTIYKLLCEIKESGAVVQVGEADNSEPDDLAAALDKLGI